MKKKFSVSTTMVFISTGIVFLLLCLTMFLSNLLIVFLSGHDLLPGQPPTAPLGPFLVQMALISILIGTVLTLCIGHLPLRPINKLMHAIHEVSEGNFDTKIHLEHPREFKELSVCFNQMTEELAGIELLRSDFVNNFSHEFKTPMVSILGFARLLKKGNLTKEEQEEYLDIIIDESQRLTSLASDILNLSKVESMSILSDSSFFNVSEQIRESVVLLESKWSKKNLSFFLDMDELNITGTEHLLKQVWMNLIDNAIKFSPSDSEIHITAHQEGSFVKITIKDNGIGIDPKAQHLIFDKFYQGDLSRSSEGNGLGLPLVKKIIALHHGTISVDSQLKKGSTFTVVLPL
ncbi:MAG: ATP-binding protein [Oliverpabstia sp.]